MELCSICGQANGHRVNCPHHIGSFTVPVPEQPYTTDRYVRDLQREIVAYEARVLTLEAENATLRSLLATARGKVQR